MIAGNEAAEGGGIRFCYFLGTLPEPLVSHNLVLENVARLNGGGIASLDADPVLRHMTIDGNEAAGAGGGAYANQAGRIVLWDSIVCNSRHGGGLVASGSGAIESSYCDVWGNAGGDYIGCGPSPTDMSCDPEYCGVDEHDVRLYDSSGCQGAASGGYDVGARGVGCFRLPEVVFYDNFSDQNDSEWIVETGPGGAVVVTEGTYRAEVVEPESFARSTVRTAPMVLTDYQYLVDVYPAGPESNPAETIELYLRFTDASRHYVVRFAPSGGELIKLDGGSSHVLHEFDLRLRPYEWQTIRLLAVGPVLQGFVMDPEAVEHMFLYHEDGVSPILEGSVGVGTRTEAGTMWARFDDALVALVDEPVAVDEAAPGEIGPPPALRVGPNPVGPGTRVRFSLGAEKRVKLVVYDIRGGRVATLVDGVLPRGGHAVPWDGRDRGGFPVASGCYVVVLRVPGGQSASKLLIVR